MPVRVDYRHHWHRPAFWRWVWREQVPLGAKVLVAFVVVCLLAAGGYTTERALPSAQTSAGSSDSGAITNVRTHVVHRRARVVVRRITTPGRTRTAYVTRTVESPARTVTVAHDVPHVVTHVVTVVSRSRTTTIVKWRTRPASTQTVTMTVPTTVVETTTVHGHGGG